MIVVVVLNKANVSKLHLSVILDLGEYIFSDTTCIQDKPSIWAKDAIDGLKKLDVTFIVKITKAIAETKSTIKT